MRLQNERAIEDLMASEESLVTLARKGNAEAFADLYVLHMDAIFRYLFYRIGHCQEAEDLTEQTFLNAWRRMGEYQSRGVPFLSYLYRIARNLLIDHIRSRREGRPLDDALEVRDESPDPETIVLSAETNRCVAEAIRTLSEVEQTVVILRFVERCDHRTVAHAIDKSETATRSIQTRALRKLAKIIGPQMEERR